MVALPPAEPPARVVAGVQVSWPLSQPETSLSPGARLTVKVASKRRRSQVSFVRVNAAGKGLRTVAKRTLRRGSFTVSVPDATPGARYALRLTVAGRKRFSWVTTPPPSPVPRGPGADADANTASLLWARQPAAELRGDQRDDHPGSHGGARRGGARVHHHQRWAGDLRRVPGGGAAAGSARQRLRA